MAPCMCLRHASSRPLELGEIMSLGTLVPVYFRTHGIGEPCPKNLSLDFLRSPAVLQRSVRARDLLRYGLQYGVPCGSVRARAKAPRR